MVTPLGAGTTVSDRPYWDGTNWVATGVSNTDAEVAAAVAASHAAVTVAGAPLTLAGQAITFNKSSTHFDLSGSDLILKAAGHGSAQHETKTISEMLIQHASQTTAVTPSWTNSFPDYAVYVDKSTLGNVAIYLRVNLFLDGSYTITVELMYWNGSAYASFSTPVTITQSTPTSNPTVYMVTSADISARTEFSSARYVGVRYNLSQAGTGYLRDVKIIIVEN